MLGTTMMSGRGRLTVLVAVAALALAACGGSEDPAEEPTGEAGDPTPSEGEATEDATGADSGIAVETDEITVGLALSTTVFSPFYWAEAEGLWEEAGLSVELVEFGGGGDALQAFAGGAVDVLATSLSGAINVHTSGQDVKAFWGGMNAADFAWYMQPDYTGWDDIRGGTAGVSSAGSLTDYLLRRIATENGLEPETDFQIVQTGATAAGFAALRSGEIDAVHLSPPTKYIAEDEGFALLARQSEEVSPEWPKDVLLTQTSFLEENPGTLTVLAKGFSDAIAWAEENQDAAVEIIASRFEVSEDHARRTYEELKPSLAADGRLPDAASMEVFWQSMVDAGDVEAELPLEEWWTNEIRDALGYDSAPVG